LEAVQNASPNNEDYVLVTEEIDPKYQIMAVVDRFERSRKSPIILFKNVRGSKFPCVVNVCASRKRIARSLGVNRDELFKKYLSALDNPHKPTMVSEGPIHERIILGDKVNLFDLPKIFFHENEGGPYITAGLLIAKHPKTGIRNLSYNRLMIKDKDKMCIHMTVGKHLWECHRAAKDLGKPLEICVVLGNHPGISLGSLYPGAFGIDEYDIIGGLIGKSLEIVPAKTVNIEVPASSEIVIEGEILPDDLDDEGPFCEFAGYMVDAAKKPVVRVKAITHRNNAIYQTICSGSHYEHLLMGAIPMEANIFKGVRAAVPSITDVHVPTGLTCFISIKKRAQGQGINALLAAFASDLYMKQVVVVDDDIDVHDTRQVLWAMATRVQPERDLLVIRNSRGSDLDPSCSEEGITSKIGIDATAKPLLQNYPPVGLVSQDALGQVEAIFSKYNSGSLSRTAEKNV